MFNEIHSALRLDKHTSENKRINIVQDPTSDASFLLHHFTSVAVKSNANILLIALEQTIGHFHGVGMKLGYDILKLQKKGQFVFYDALKNVHQSYQNEHQSKESTENVFDFDSNFENALSNLSKTIENKISEFEDSSKPLYVIIDKLSLFLSIGITISKIIPFLLKVQQLVLDRKGTLVTLTNGVSGRVHEKTHLHEIDTGDEQENKLVSFLDHTSHLTVVVWKLKTGYSEIVSGNICFGWARESADHHSTQDGGRYQYNIEEKDVKVFALGTSSAVL